MAGYSSEVHKPRLAYAYGVLALGGVGFVLAGAGALTTFADAYAGAERMLFLWLLGLSVLLILIGWGVSLLAGIEARLIEMQRDAREASGLSGPGGG